MHAAGIWWPKGQTGVRFAARVLTALGTDVDALASSGETDEGDPDVAALRRACASWRAEAGRYAQNDLDRQAEAGKLRTELASAHERVRELIVVRNDLAGQRDRLAESLGDAERECTALRAALEHTRLERDEYRARLQHAQRGRVQRWLSRLGAGLRRRRRVRRSTAGG